MKRLVDDLKDENEQYRKMVMESIETEKLNEARNQYLKDLISGKTLIE